MSNREVDDIRDMLRSRPRPVGLAERRERLDRLGAGFALPPDVRTESVQAGAVPAEWTETPGVEPGPVILFLHGAAMFPAQSRATGT